jgi:N,N'-diacetylchitobiose transport system permease protein
LSPRPAPNGAAVAAAGPAPGARRRRPLTLQRLGAAVVPYLLVLPVIVAIGAILGYPLYQLVTLSFQRYGLPELIQRKGEWIGFDNYRSVLGDEVFWDMLRRLSRQ